MTKQEEIRKLVDSCVRAVTNNRSLQTECLFEAAVDNILQGLDERGVVIKVERKLPTFPPDSELHPYGQAYVKGGRAYVQTLVDAGYVAVEPLIKEE